MMPDRSTPLGATLTTRPVRVSLGRASTLTWTGWPGRTRAASASSKGTTTWNESAASSVTNAPDPGVLPPAVVPVPPEVAGSGAVPPGARAVTADGEETTSPAVPLIAVTVAAAG